MLTVDTSLKRFFGNFSRSMEGVTTHPFKLGITVMIWFT
jgi:hypothetical protein